MATLARNKISLWFIFAIVIICRAEDVLWSRRLPNDIYENLSSEGDDLTFDSRELQHLRSDTNPDKIEAGIARSFEDGIGIDIDTDVESIVGGHSVPSTSDRGSFSEAMSGAYGGTTVITHEINGGITNSQIGATIVGQGANGVAAPNYLNGGTIYWVKSNGATSGNGYSVTVLDQGRIIVDTSKNTQFGTTLFWLGADGIIVPIYFIGGNGQGVNGASIANIFGGRIVVKPGGIIVDGSKNVQSGSTFFWQGVDASASSNAYVDGITVGQIGNGGTSNAEDGHFIFIQGANVGQGGSGGTSSNNNGGNTIIWQGGNGGNPIGNNGGIIFGQGGSGSISTNINGGGSNIGHGFNGGNSNGNQGSIIFGQGGSGSISTDFNGGDTSIGRGSDGGNSNGNNGGLINGQGGSGGTSSNNNGGGTIIWQGGNGGNSNAYQGRIIYGQGGSGSIYGGGTFIGQGSNGGNQGSIIYGQGGSGSISTNNNGGGTIIGQGVNSNGNNGGFIYGQGSFQSISTNINSGTLIGQEVNGGNSNGNNGHIIVEQGPSEGTFLNGGGGTIVVHIDDGNDGIVAGQGGTGGTAAIIYNGGTNPFGYNSGNFFWHGVHGGSYQNGYNEASMFANSVPYPVVNGGGAVIVTGGIPGSYNILGDSGVMGAYGGAGLQSEGAEAVGGIGGATGIYGGISGNVDAGGYISGSAGGSFGIY
ncbi:uncharacterized PE-PGRS family protein PE_PGRS34-like [Helicoverpa zea]|uniref:uncharacterized PE-PGRS family protein PE_PGRS34-like n=1 Tax=Helicoverpa zea TaxID=7113 RepID=UPI001F55D37D|nr:uncharacterized PE-PGRS family protein PE_PGRS34-like [Helicoverpa zea]